MVIGKEEIENIKLKTTNTIEIKEFINSEEFDPNWYPVEKMDWQTNKKTGMKAVKIEKLILWKHCYTCRFLDGKNYRWI